MKPLKSIKIAVLFILVFLPVVSVFSQKEKVGKKSNSNLTAIDTTWKTLSLREKIGQTMMVTSSYYEQRQIGGGSMESFYKKYPVGGFFIATWYFQYAAPADIPLETSIRLAMEDYNRSSRFPPFFSEDFERGVGLTHAGYTHMPAEMSLGAANNTKLAYDFGRSVALESKDWGINWLLHPVSDLNMNPLHPLVIERAISDDPERAIPLLKEQIRGIHSEKIISTVKHFPGDGATIRDQHMITGANNLSWDDWKNSYGKVFSVLIEEDAPSIMIGHIRFPAYQSDTLNGVLPPSSLSKDIIQKLLKGEMKYKGVVMSDALNMGGSAGYYENELETMVAAFVAGTDMMLWPSLAYMDTVEARILRGEIPMERLDDAVSRIWALRVRFELLKKPATVFTPLTSENQIFIRETAQKIANEAVTLVRNTADILPITTQKDSTILLVNISYFDKTGVFETTRKLLEEKGFKVELRHGLSFYEYGWRLPYFDQYSKIIVCFENKYFEPLGTSYFKGDEALAMWTINMLPQEKIIGISYSNPYYVSFYMDRCPTLINAYSSDPASQEAVVKALLGEIEFRGSSPVRLEHEILK